MKYCTQCGKPVAFCIPEGDDRERVVCPDCGFVHYQNPKPIVGCLPLWQDQVLLCSRAIEPRRGFWTLPCGFMEQGETVQEGALRETWEEARAQVEIRGLHVVYSLPHVSQVYLIFLADMKESDFAAGSESLEVRLFQEEDIPWEHLAFSSMHFALRAFFEDRTAGHQPQLHLGEFRRST